jgi:hypothetical protein
MFTGCQKGDPRSKTLVPAAGVVVYKGSPVTGATVTFFNEDDPRKPGGSAITKDNGTFAISMYGDGDGTNPGNYKVTVVKIEVKSTLTDEQILEHERKGEAIPENASKSVSLLPKKYENKKSSDISIVIPPKGDKEIKIELKD